MQIDRRHALALAALVPAFAGRAGAEPIDEEKSSLVEPGGVPAANAEVVRRQHALINSGDIAGAVMLFAEDTRNHGVPVGRKGLTRVLADIHTTFPDWRMETENLVAIGDDVIVRCIVTGTHKGVGKIPVNGGLLVGVPPTGKSFRVQHIHWYTLKEGLIVEHRANRDDVGMMQELGLLPAVKRYDLPAG